jgi:hypothetical protein
MQPDFKAMFAIVRVQSVERFTDENLTTREGQYARCSVVYDYFDVDGVNPPFSGDLKIRQNLYGGCMSEEETNLLRVGGVYVLPLANYQSQEYWWINGDLDCLFEVDDGGRIQAHSRHVELSKYDGKPLAVLWDDIAYLHANPILLSTLAGYVSSGCDVVSDGKRVALHYTNPEWYGWDTPDIASRYSADISPDGRITIATDAFNVFRPVEGMTLAEMESAIAAIRQYLRTGG